MYKDPDHYTLYKRGSKWGYYCYEDGKRKFLSTGRESKREAIALINERIRTGRLVRPEGSGNEAQTLEEYTRDFFVHGKCPIEAEHVRLGRKFEETTEKIYRWKLEKWLVPVLGKKKLGRIAPADVIALQDRMLSEGLGGSYINDVVAVLSEVMKKAIRDGIIQENPTKNVLAMSRKPKKERKVPTKEDMEKLFGELQWDNFIARDACLLSSYTAMRMGEVRGLRVGCIHDGVIDVTWNFSPILNRSKSTKSGKKRIVPLPPSMKEELEDLCSGRKPDDYVFSVDGRKPMTLYLINKDFRARLEELGYGKGEITFHSFRHYFNTVLVSEGVSELKIRSVVGHSSREMTERYLHLSVDDLGDISNVQKKLAEEDRG